MKCILDGTLHDEYIGGSSMTCGIPHPGWAGVYCEAEGDHSLHRGMDRLDNGLARHVHTWAWRAGQFPVRDTPDPSMSTYTIEDAIKACHKAAKNAEINAEHWRQAKEAAATSEAYHLAERDRYFDQADDLHKAKELAHAQ